MRSWIESHLPKRKVSRSVEVPEHSCKPQYPQGLSMGAVIVISSKHIAELGDSAKNSGMFLKNEPLFKDKKYHFAEMDTVKGYLTMKSETPFGIPLFG